MINPHWLASFATLAELKNFTRSADKLGITQAAVSQHVKQLEQCFGTLLVRRPRGVELTPAGVALLEYCAEIDRADRRLKTRLTATEEAEGEIGLISPGSIGLRLYPMLLTLQQQLPKLCIKSRFAPDAEVVNAVLNNDYELGLTTIKPDNPRLSATPFIEEPLELVVPASYHGCGWQALWQLGYIDHPDGKAMATRLLSRRFPGCPGISTLPITGYSNQVGLLLEPVARGLGFTVIPHYARRAFAQQQAIAVVDCGVTVVDTLWLIHRAEWPLSARASKALDFLQQQLALSEADTSRPHQAAAAGVE